MAAFGITEAGGRRSGGKGMFRLLKVAVVLLLLCVGVIIIQRASITPEAQKSGPPTVPTSTQAPADRPSPAKIIEQARALDRRMAESNRPKPLAESLKSPLITKAEIHQAREALRSIDKTQPEYAEAQSLLVGLDKREQEGKRAAETVFAKAKADDVEGRKAYAKEYEHNALMAGLSVTVTTSGPKATTLNLSYALLSKANIYQIINDGAFQRMLRDKGFSKLHVTDGHNWFGDVGLH